MKDERKSVLLGFGANDDRGEDGNDLVCLIEQSGNLALRFRTGPVQQLEPVKALARLFLGDRVLVDKVFSAFT